MKRGLIVGGAFSLAGLVITHNIMPLIFLPAIPVLALAMIDDLRSLWTNSKITIGWATMAILGALLSAYFWLPVALDRHLVHTDYFLQVNYREEFVGLGELLGTTLTHTLTSELGVPLAIFSACGVTAGCLASKSRISRRLLLATTILTLAYVFIMNYRSEFLWARVPLLPCVQLPWRLLAPITFFLSLAAGALPGSVSSWGWRWLLAVVVPVIAIQVHQPLIALPRRIDSQSLARLQICSDIWGTQDYRPVWSGAAFWQSTKPPEATDNRPVLMPCQGRPTFAASDANKVTSFVEAGAGFKLDFSANIQDTLTVPIFYYPTWRVEIDGSPIALAPESRTGLIQIQVPAGEHTIVGALGRDFAQSVGNDLAILGVFMVFGIPLAMSRRS
jgi:hypothetical protein